MVDLVTTQWLFNGPRHAIGKFTNVSDGTGETGVVKVDATLTGPLTNRYQGNVLAPGVHLTVYAIKYSTSGMALRLQWQATANTDMLVVSATDHWALQNEREGFAGLVSPVVAGATGSIVFTTVGAATNSSYTIILYLLKNIAGAP